MATPPRWVYSQVSPESALTEVPYSLTASLSRREMNCQVCKERHTEGDDALKSGRLWV